MIQLEEKLFQSHENPDSFIEREFVKGVRIQADGVLKLAKKL